MPLRRGQLAVLIAAGFLNNILLEADGRRVLVKGRTYKETVPVESDDPDIEIEREVLRTSVVALDLRSGRLDGIEHYRRYDEFAMCKKRVRYTFMGTVGYCYCGYGSVQSGTAIPTPIGGSLATTGFTRAPSFVR